MSGWFLICHGSILSLDARPDLGGLGVYVGIGMGVNSMAFNKEYYR